MTTCLDYEFHGCGAIDPETGFQRLGVLGRGHCVRWVLDCGFHRWGVVSFGRVGSGSGGVSRGGWMVH